PKVEIPKVEIPKVELPKLPTFTMPSMPSLPSIDLGSIEVPSSVSAASERGRAFVEDSMKAASQQAESLSKITGEVRFLRQDLPVEFLGFRPEPEPSTQKLEIRLFLALWVVLLALKGFAFVDCLRAPGAVFPSIGRQTKILWLVLTGLALLTGLVPNLTLSLFGIAGAVIALIYLFDIRPRIKSITGP
ncbi:MAG: DUF2516 family protein, partial [Actinobacteria bacterium]|nr:DUF2516 family protein [Actinomycetota bacterium]